MKTPIRELIEWLDSKIESESLDLFREPLEQVREKAESLINKEKEVIMDAHSAGYEETVGHFSANGRFPYAINYYNETFNTKD